MKNETFSKTKMLVRLLGLNPPYTLNEEELRKLTKEEVYALYVHAKKNKVDFLFLKSIRNHLKTSNYGNLLKLHEIAEKNYRKFLLSINQTSEFLHKMGIAHVFIKTLYPFPMLPSDIDILIDDCALEDCVKHLGCHGYRAFDNGPHFNSLYNLNVDERIPREKKSYDIDLYDQIALNHLIYINKALFQGMIRKLTVDYGGIEFDAPAYSAECELTIHVNHSMFEHLFTLSHLYAITSLFNEVDTRSLLDLFENTGSQKIVRKLFNLILNVLPIDTSETQTHDALGKLMKIVDSMNINDLSVNDSNIELPYKFTLMQLIDSLTEKMQHSTCARSLISMILSMRNHENFKHIIYQIIQRRKRTTY